MNVVCRKCGIEAQGDVLKLVCYKCLKKEQGVGVSKPHHIECSDTFMHTKCTVKDKRNEKHKR